MKDIVTISKLFLTVPGLAAPVSVSVRLETRQRVSPSPSCDITQSEHRVAEKYIVLLQSYEVSTLSLVNM